MLPEKCFRSNICALRSYCSRPRWRADVPVLALVISVSSSRLERGTPFPFRERVIVPRLRKVLHDGLIWVHSGHDQVLRVSLKA